MSALSYRGSVSGQVLFGGVGGASPAADCKTGSVPGESRGSSSVALAENMILKPSPFPKGLMTVLANRHTILAVRLKVYGTATGLAAERHRHEAALVCFGRMDAHYPLISKVDTHSGQG